jgi:hypothetical protein
MKLALIFVMLLGILPNTPSKCSKPKSCAEQQKVMYDVLPGNLLFQF